MLLRGVKLRVQHLMALVAIVAVVLCLLIPSAQVAVWDGSFDLLVTVENRSWHTIIAAAAQPLGRTEVAELVVAHDGDPDLLLEDVHWVAGQPFTVRIPCSGRRSMTGRELSYYQFQALLVRVEFADGAKRLLSVKIPDGRVSRSASILIP